MVCSLGSSAAPAAHTAGWAPAALPLAAAARAQELFTQGRSDGGAHARTHWRMCAAALAHWHSRVVAVTWRRAMAHLVVADSALRAPTSLAPCALVVASAFAVRAAPRDHSISHTLHAGRASSVARMSHHSHTAQHTQARAGVITPPCAANTVAISPAPPQMADWGREMSMAMAGPMLGRPACSSKHTSHTGASAPHWHPLRTSGGLCGGPGGQLARKPASCTHHIKRHDQQRSPSSLTPAANLLPTKGLRGSSSQGPRTSSPNRANAVAARRPPTNCPISSSPKRNLPRELAI